MNLPYSLPEQLLNCFDEQWLAALDWQPLDQLGGLNRWRVYDSRAARHWLVVRAGQQAAQWESAGLDHEYALAAHLDPAWALLPVARLSCTQGTLLVLDDQCAAPISALPAPLGVAHFLQLALACTRALGGLHAAGLVHRNLAPEQLMLRSDGNVRLTGFARAVATEKSSQSYALGVGQPAYLPAEQAGTCGADWYALGVCFFQWLTGCHPFEAQDAMEWQHRHIAVAAPAPSSLRPGLPAYLDELLLWMLGKQSASRPHQAAEVEIALRRCLLAWREGPVLYRGGNEATHLIGRENELASLQHARQRLLQGHGGVVLISGEAGIGKTALVRSLCQQDDDMVLLFASSKCQLPRRGEPYEALGELFAGLCTRLLGEPDARLQARRQQLQELVAEHGGHVLRLIPALAPLLANCAPLGDLRPDEARRYLQGILQQLLCTMASAEQPLLLFVDDVQWIDAESSALLAELPRSAFKHLLLILASRPQADALPARKLLNACRTLGDDCQTLELEALEAGCLSESLAPDTAQADVIRQLPPEQRVSPLYLQQFVALRAEGGVVPATSVSLDVSGLLTARLHLLPQATRELLEMLALLGDRIALSELIVASALPQARVRHALLPALQAGLLAEQGERLVFAHDSIPETLRAALSAQRVMMLQARLATNLVSALQDTASDLVLSRVATHLLRVVPAVLSTEQCLEYADLLLLAAAQAIDTAAAGQALAYLHQAEVLLDGRVDPLRRRQLDLQMVRGLILNADYSTAEHRIAHCLSNLEASAQRIELQRLSVEILCLQGRYEEAMSGAMQALAELGVDFPPAPSLEQAEAAWRAFLDEMGARTPCHFISLAAAEDDAALSVMGLLAVLMIPGSFVQPNLLLLANCQIVRLTLQHGLSAPSVQALAWLGVAAAERFECYEQGFALAVVARELVERPEYASGRMSVLLALDQVSAWSHSLPYALDCAEQAFRASLSKGAPSFACYASNHIVTDLLVLGAPIERMLQQIDTGLAMAHNLEFLDAQSRLHIQARYIRHLAGDNASVWSIPDAKTLQERVESSEMMQLHFWWWLFEGLLAFLEGSFATAETYLQRAWKLTWAVPVHIHQIDLAMFSVLNRAALQRQSGEQQDYAEPLRRLRLWAQLNPRYFQDRLALAEAEVVRVGGDSLQALRLYERAIDCAEAVGAVHIKGLGHELAARCHLDLQLLGSGREHLRQAHAAWRRWGAHRLAEQMERAHGFLAEVSNQANSPVAMAEHLDRLSITRVCQALSQEIEPQALIEALLANAATHACASYVALLLIDGNEQRVAACGESHCGGVRVRWQPSEPLGQLLPVVLVRQAMQAREPILVDGGYALRGYTDDPYLRQLDDGSVLCLPLLKQSETIGALYLENRLASGAIDPARIDLLTLLAAQAAISLSHGRLYADLLAENQRRSESERNLRRTQALLALGQEISRYGTFIWRWRAEPSFWSVELLAELGIAAPDMPTYLQRPEALVHADDYPRFTQALFRALEEQSGLHLEFRCLLPEEPARYLELLLEPTDEQTYIGVISDVSERRRTEAELHTARAELERTAQIAILGELTASISHEINQPLAAILSNAGASVRWLERAEPSVDEALEGLHDILAECRRAAEIVRATRSLARKAPAMCQVLDLGQLIRQVLAIIQAELDDQHIEVVLALPDGLSVSGDSVQLQQVVRNLIQNASDSMQALPPNQRQLALVGQCVHDEVVVTVQDSGPGVPEDLQGQVFQALFSTKSSGMGMGLAICRSIIASHSGFLGVTLGRNDESLFFFTLPRYRH
ncbi:AAA family ATPase [Pseudomonas sp. SH1-B]